MFGKLSKQTTNETEIELEMGAKGRSKNIWTVEQLRELRRTGKESLLAMMGLTFRELS